MPASFGNSAGAIAMRAQVGKSAGAIMEELEDKRLLEKEKRKALEAQALDDAMSGVSYVFSSPH